MFIVTISLSIPFYPLDPSIKICSPQFGGPMAQRPLRIVAQVAHLFREFRNLRPAVTLVFGEDIAGVGCLLARLAGVRNVLVMLRGTPERSLRGLNGLLNPFLYRLSRRIVVQTRVAAEKLSPRFPADRLMTIPNPINRPELVPCFKERCNEILSVGSLGRKKNQAALIRAFAHLTNRKKWKLIFVGDGPDREMLQELAFTLGIQSEVEFTGERRDVEKHFFRARVFAFTSLSEGFPNALAEALAAGCACISYDCPTGPADLIENEVNGLLVPNNDEVALRTELDRLIGNPVLQSKLSERARHRIRQFDAEEVLDRFEDLVREYMPRSSAEQAA